MSGWVERYKERLKAEGRGTFAPKTPREAAVENLERKLHLPVSAHHVHHPITQLPDAVIEKAIEAPLVAEISAEPAAPPIAARPPRQWRRRLVFTTVVGLAVTGVLMFIAGLINAPSTGTVKALAAAESSASATPTPPPDNVLNGRYVNFTYPGQFSVIQSNPDNTGPDLEAYLLRRPVSLAAGPGMTLAVEVDNLPVGGLEQDSAYRYRQLYPNLYTASQILVDGEAATMMTKSDGGEKTLFWAHANLELTVAISVEQGNDLDDITSVMNTVLNDIHWSQS